MALRFGNSQRTCDNWQHVPITHGNNCIGNNRKEDERAPHIGNNVEIGVGAKIIGDIYVVDNVKIGANAVVVKSCFTNGATLVGVPAHEVIR